MRIAGRFGRHQAALLPRPSRPPHQDRSTSSETARQLSGSPGARAGGLRCHCRRTASASHLASSLLRIADLAPAAGPPRSLCGGILCPFFGTPREQARAVTHPRGAGVGSERAGPAQRVPGALFPSPNALPAAYANTQIYVKDVEDSFSSDAIAAIGICAQRVPAVAPECLQTLIKLTQSKNGSSSSLYFSSFADPSAQTSRSRKLSSSFAPSSALASSLRPPLELGSSAG